MSIAWFHVLADYEYAMRVDEDVCLIRLPRIMLAAAVSAAGQLQPQHEWRIFS
jgi:hypothetical protein